MESFKNTQREYLYEKIDNILLTISKTNEDYIELTNKYNRELEELKQELSSSQLEKLDNILSLLNLSKLNEFSTFLSFFIYSLPKISFIIAPFDLPRKRCVEGT